MIDWKEVEELYAAARSDNQQVRDTAQAAIDANIDAWITEYLASPEAARKYSTPPWTNKGDPMFRNFDELARWTTSLLQYPHGEWDEYCARREVLHKDKLGIILRHRKQERAKELHPDDWTFVTLYGERYALGLQPAVVPGDPKPQYEEFILPNE